MPRLLLLLALCALLCFPAVAAAGNTYPRDDTGAAAAVCATVNPWGSAVTSPTPCSATNPLPVVNVSPAVQAAGLSWFGNTQTLSGRAISAIWIGPSVLAGITPTGSQISVNGGRSFSGVATLSPTTNTDAFNGNLFNNSLIQLPAAYGVASACSNGGTACSPFWTLSRDLATGTLATQTGLTASSTVGQRALIAWEIEQQGSTLFSVVTNQAGGSIAGSPFACTAPTAGTPWTCTSQAATFGVLQPTAGQQIASPGTTAAGVNIWLVLGISGSTKTLFRSTDNGATFTAVFTFSAAPSNNMGAVLCLTVTTCVATDGVHIAQSTNAGLTWTQVATGGSLLSGFANYGNGIVVALGDTNQTGTFFFVSSDFGATWIPGPSFKFSTGNPVGGQYLQISVQGTSAVAANSTSANGAVPNIFAYLPPSQTTVVGPNGQTVQPDANGNLPITGGTGMTAVTVSGSVTASGTVTANQGLGIGAPVSPWAVRAPEQFAPSSDAFNNSSTTGAANTAVTITLTQATNVAWRLHSVDAFCSAGSATLTITDGGTTIWVSPTGAVTTARFEKQWFTPLQTNGAAPAITLSPCGVGNTGTVNLQAARW